MGIGARDADGTPIPVSRDGVHVLLWNQSTRGKLRLQLEVFADQVGITREALSRMITTMVAEGRLKVLSRGHGRTGVYVVTDPRAWFSAHGETG